MKRLLFILAILLGVHIRVEASVSINATGTVQQNTGAASPRDYTGLTIAAGSNIALVVTIAIPGATTAISTVTWDQGGSNQAMTLIKAQNNADFGTERGEIWGLVNPATGNKTLRVTYTGSIDTHIEAIAFNGADQTGGATTFPNSTSTFNLSADPSLVITSATNNYTVALGVAGGGNNFTTHNQTTIYINGVTTQGVSGATSGAGAATVTHTWTRASNVWTMVGTDILAAAAGGSFKPYSLPLTGVGRASP